MDHRPLSYAVKAMGDLWEGHLLAFTETRVGGIRSRTMKVDSKPTSSSNQNKYKGKENADSCVLYTDTPLLVQCQPVRTVRTSWSDLWLEGNDGGDEYRLRLSRESEAELTSSTRSDS